MLDAIRTPRMAALVGVVAAALALRLLGLPGQSFWTDEGYTWLSVDGGLGDVLPTVRDLESSPPLYFWLVWGWGQVFGTGDLALRSLSLLLGVATVPLAYTLGRELAGPAAGLAAAALVAVNPFLVWYSQEVRSYALFTFLALLSLQLLIRAERTGARAWLLGWAVACGLALATHYYASFLVWAEVAWLLWRRRDRWVVGCAGALGLVQLALLPLLTDQTDNSATIAEQGLAGRVAGAAKQFLLGQYADQLDSPLLVATAIALALASAVVLLRSDAARRHAGWMLVLAALLVLAPLVFSVVGPDRFNGRNVIVALALALVATGAGLWSAEWAGARVLLGVLVVFFTAVTVAVATTPRLQRDDWKAVGNALDAEAHPLAVVVDPGVGVPALSRYTGDLFPVLGEAEVQRIAYVRVERPPGVQEVSLPGFAETRRVRTASGEVVFLEARRARSVSRDRLAAEAPAGAAVLFSP